MLRVANINCAIQDIYRQFLKFGPLIINIKRGYVLVKYKEVMSAVQAQKQLNKKIINNQKLNVSIYNGEELQDLIQQKENSHDKMDIQNNSIPKDKFDEIKQQCCKMIEDQNIEKYLDKQFKDFRIRLRKYFQQKSIQIRTKYPKPEDETKIEQFKKLLEREIKVLKFESKKITEKMLNNLQQFQHKHIDLQQGIHHNKKINYSFMNTKEFQNKEIEYQNTKGQVKKLFALSDTQFMASLANKVVKIYEQSDYKAKHQIQCKNIPYGLALYNIKDNQNNIKSHMLVGEQYGSISNASLNPPSASVCQNLSIFEHADDINMKQIIQIKQCFGTKGQSRYATCNRLGYFGIFNITHQQFLQNEYILELKSIKQSYTQGKILSLETLNKENLVLSYNQRKTKLFNIEKWLVQNTRTFQDKVFKVLRDKSHTYYAAVNQNIQVIDIRQKKTTKVFKGAKEINSLAKLGQYKVAYGALKTIGLIDTRYTKTTFWSNSQVHKSHIRDLIVVGSKLISGGKDDKIICWNPI